jgi:tetratricopeptide (TPR) repeat protein
MDMEEVLSQALLLGDEERWDEMADLLASALEQDPDEPYILCWMGVAERELGNDGSAYEFFRRCIAQEPGDPQLLAIVGAGLAAFDDPDAEATLRAAVLTGPELALTHLQYGAYLARSGLFDEALEQLRTAIQMEPDDPIAHGELGIALALKGDYEGAIEAFDAALQRAPDDSWTRVLLGLLYADRGMMRESAESLLEAAEQRDDDPEAHVLAALAAAVVGWDEAAQKSVARAEFAANGGEAEMISEAEERVSSGPERAKEMLLDTLGPSVLHDRLMQPL